VFARSHMYPDTDVVASFSQLPLRVSAATWCFFTSPPTPLVCSPVRLSLNCPSLHPICFFFLFFLCWVHSPHASAPRFITVCLTRRTQRRWCMRSCGGGTRVVAASRCRRPIRAPLLLVPLHKPLPWLLHPAPVTTPPATGSSAGSSGVGGANSPGAVAPLVRRSQ